MKKYAPPSHVLCVFVWCRVQLQKKLCEAVVPENVAIFRSIATTSIPPTSAKMECYPNRRHGCDFSVWRLSPALRSWKSV